MDEDSSIPTRALTPDNVPAPDSERQVLEEFCLTFDGYQNGCHSVDGLMTQADRVEQAGLRNATLDELRAAAFIRQRHLRWSSHGDDVADEPLVEKNPPDSRRDSTTDDGRVTNPVTVTRFSLPYPAISRLCADATK